MRVVYCLDKNYMEYAKISAESIKRFNPDAKFTVVSLEKLENIPFQCENVVIPINREFRKRNENDRISKTAYLKLYLTNLSYDKILYVDADVICQKPLNELWEMKCPYICLTESHNYGKEQAKDLGLEKYGLSGMMLMNLGNLRQINFTERCLEAEKTANPKLWCHDETLINVAMNGLLKFIPVKYNYCHNREYDNPILEENAYILHYVGKDKSDMLKRHYEELNVIKEYLKGKSVAIVGNARSIFDKNKGNEIDNHDIVIRFNKGYIITPLAQGKRTNILLCSCDVDLSRFNAKYVINRSKNTTIGNITISQQERRRLKNILGYQPSTGFMAIDVCLHSGVKSIDLYGFDFGKTDTYYNPSGYETQHCYSIEEDMVKNYEKNGILKINY